MDGQGRAGGRDDLGHRADVVEVGVGEQHVPAGPLALGERGEYLVCVRAGIYDDGVARGRVGDEVAVGLDGAERELEDVEGRHRCGYCTACIAGSRPRPNLKGLDSRRGGG